MQVGYANNTLGQPNGVTVTLPDLAPHLSGVTLELWCSNQDIETFAGSGRGLDAISVSRVVAGFEGGAGAELQASLRIPEGAVDPARLG